MKYVHETMNKEELTVLVRGNDNSGGIRTRYKCHCCHPNRVHREFL